MARVAGEEGLNLVKRVLKTIVDNSGYGKVCSKITFTSAGNGNCTAEFTIDKDMLNTIGTLHGGCTATIMDVISSTGLMTYKETAIGVSVNLSVNYLKGGTEGQKIVIDSKALKVGKRLAYLDVKFKTKDEGDVIASGSHILYIMAQ